MKKNFFKKLSFVLALAMIVSTIAPAAGAFAATKAPKLSSAQEYLFLGSDNDTSYDFNVAYKQAGWTYAWKSSKTSVATVNKSGVVTAKAIGTTTVSVAIKKGTKAVATLKATVIVKDNIAEVKIANAPKDNKLTIGEKFDFNRSYTTVSGSTTKTTSIVRWEVDNATDASINDSGVFSATKAGKYTITARAFQSTAKYEAWLADKAAKYVLDDATVTVDVVPSITAINQLSSTKFDVVFDSKVNDTLKDFVVKNDAGVTQVVKEVKWNEAGNTATVELYISLTDAKTYTVTVGDLEKTFVASVGAPAKIVITGPSLVQYGVAKALTFKLYDKNGVEVTGAGNATYEITNNVGWVDQSNITLFNINDVASVKATYHTNTYDVATGDEITLTSDVYQVKAVESLAATTKGMTAWTISTAASANVADYTTVNHSITLTDVAGYHIFAKGKDTSDADVYFTKFTSTDPARLIVDADGSLYPVAVGQVNVIAETADGYKQTLLVDVKAAKAASFVSLKGSASIVLSNAIATDTATFEIVVKDQYQNEMAAAAVTVDQYAQPDGAGHLDYTTPANGKVVFTPTIGGAAAPEGTYRFKLTTQDKVVVVAVIVKQPVAAVSYSKLTTEVSSLDVAVSDNTTTVPSIKIYSRTYDSTGVANGVTSASVTVTGPNNYSVTGTAVAGELILNAATNNGGVLTPLAAGTYKVEGTVSGNALVPAYFTITNTQKLPTVTANAITLNVARNSSVEAAIAAAGIFTATENGGGLVAISDYDIASASLSGGAFAQAGTYSVLVQNVYVTETFDHFSVVHKVVKNAVVTVTVQ